MNRDEVAAELERLRLENDQLLESRRLADETRDRYMDLYDCAPLAYLTLDGVGVIRDLNQAAVELLGGNGRGYPLVGTRLKRLVRGADHEVLAAHLRRGPVERDAFSCELRLQDSTPIQLWSRRIRSVRR